MEGMFQDYPPDSDEQSLFGSDADDINDYDIQKDVKPLYIVPRDCWKARPPKGELPQLRHPVPNTVFTYTETDTCPDMLECTKLLRRLQKNNMETGMDDIQYNYYISEDLTVYEGRGWHHTSTFTLPDFERDKEKVLAICYIGRYNNVDDYVSEEVEQMRESLLDHGIEQGFVKEDFNNYPTIV